MNYFKRYYLLPFASAVRKWKDYLYTFIIEVAFIFLIVLIAFLMLGRIQKYATTLGDNELDDKIIFLANVQNYNSELSNYLGNLYVMSFLMVLLFFVLYSLSRYVIWRILLKANLKFWRSIGLDAIFFIAAFLILIVCLNLIRPEYYSIFLLFTLLPLMYYYFFVHMSLKEISTKRIFRSAFSMRMILLLPHMIVFLIVSLFLWANFNYIGVLVSLIILNFFRIYALEVGNNLHVKSL